MEIWLGLVGVIVGGLLVMATDLARLRSEEKRYWTRELRSSAGAVVETFGAAMSAMNEARANQQPMPDRAALAYEERNRRWGYFRMTPKAARLGPDLAELRDALENLRDAFDAEDSTWKDAHRRMHRALIGMEDGVRRTLDPSEK